MLAITLIVIVVRSRSDVNTHATDVHPERKRMQRNRVFAYSANSAVGSSASENLLAAGSADMSDVEGGRDSDHE